MRLVKKPTLNDVVKESGLSIFTVSRALNGAEGVSAESRSKVLEAAKSIGYVPNKAARALRTQSPGPVIVMTASTANYYYIDMIDGIQAGLRVQWQWVWDRLHPQHPSCGGGGCCNLLLSKIASGTA